MTQLLPSINKVFKGQIWRMEIDGITDTIYLEVRRAEDKSVFFAAVDLSSGEIKFENVVTPERWLTGLEAAFGGVMLLHGYQSQNSPVHKGITAVDAGGNIIWSNYAITFDHLSINGPVNYASQIRPQKLMLADIKTGQNIRSYNPLVDIEYTNDISYPEHRRDADLNLKLPAKSYNEVLDYITCNGCEIVSLHTLLDGQLKQYLYVLRGEDVVYCDLLNDNIQKMQPEAFIIFKNRVIYIKNKSELRVVCL